MKSLYKLIKRTERGGFFALRHMKRLGAVKGLHFARAAAKAGQLIETPLPDSESQVSLRAGTSDISVFEDTFVWQHYDMPYPEQPATIIDAGAHIGLASIYFSQRFPDAKIIALEPHPANFELLTKNCAAFPNITPVNAALWTEEGSLAVADPDAPTWSFRFHPSEQGDIRATCIDALMSEHDLKHIDLLKVDIEGSEKEVFEHAAGWLPKVSSIVVELHDDLQAGCSRSFYAATGKFPNEVRVQENLLVSRLPLAD